MQIFLLTHQREILKKTGTGQLVKKNLGSDCTIIIWKRKEPSSILESEISPENSILVYPEEASDENPDLESIENFILIDGTWQESQKIFNRTPCLKRFRRLTLPPDIKSKYTLRRNQKVHGLCTIECVIALFRLKGLSVTADQLEREFTHFLRLKGDKISPLELWKPNQSIYNTKMRLSKSLYMRGLQCPKSLWIKVHEPRLLSLADRDLESRHQSEELIGELARQLFPGGAEIPYSTPERQTAQSQEYINSGIKVLYNATFEFNNVLVMVDIVVINGENQITIYEVKDSTSVKRNHLDDLSIPFYVLSGLGYQIKSSNILCINKKYIREESLDLNQLFDMIDVTEQVKNLQETIPRLLDHFQSVLDREPMPEIPIGTYCTSPRLCEAKDYCWKHIPSPSVFDISALSMEIKMKFYTQGIIQFHEITDFKDLTTAQKIQIESELSGQSVIDKKVVTKFLEGVTYPIFYLDFEAFQQAVPLWPGIKPYSQIPFQYSLHIEKNPGILEHHEFLAEQGEDPRQVLAERLISDIGESGTILVYNKTFEKGIIRNLALQYPHLAGALEDINKRIVDLIIPFQSRAYYSPLMGGSYSIKKVLPSLVPEMTDAYKNLNYIHNGVEAMNAYARQVPLSEEYKTALLKYCELDTMAMVKILKVLKDV